MEWQPIETAPDGDLVVVGWLDADDPETPERHDFDYKEDGVWVKHEELYQEFCAVAPPGSRGPREQAPYTHWMAVQPLPLAQRLRCAAGVASPHERIVIRLHEGGRMVSEVFRICDAYEAGYGKGQTSSQDENPFPEGSKESEAWDIGYQNAIKLELERFGVLPYNGLITSGAPGSDEGAA